MTTAPPPPQPHFPSRYSRPSLAPSVARCFKRQDGAQVACFVYGELGCAGGAGGDSELGCAGGAGGDSGLGCAGGAGGDAELEPVVFIHGNGEEHGIFGPMIDAVVTDGRAAIGIDSRGQGRSSRGTDRLTYELLADDALACLDELGVGRFHLVGFSDGAIEALILARDHTDRVASLLSMGANLTPEGVAEDDDWDIHGAISSNKAWSEWASGLPADGAVDPALLMPTATEAAWTADLLQLMLDEPHIPAESLQAIECPTTIMAGEFDVIIPSETYQIARAIKAGGVDVRLVIVPGAGHSLPKQVPDVVTRVMRATISRSM